jgi:hypothetical protein
LGAEETDKKIMGKKTAVRQSVADRGANVFQSPDR